MEAFAIVVLLLVLAALVSIAIGGFILGRRLLNIAAQATTLHNTEEGNPPTRLFMPVATLDPHADVTTVLPLPPTAQYCEHKFDVITNEILRQEHEERMVLVLHCPKCGALDKTVQCTTPAPIKPTPPIPPLPRSECKHKWVKEKSVTLDSAFEQMEAVLKEKAGSNRSAGYGGTAVSKKDALERNFNFDLNTAPPWMFKKTYIAVRICSICGEIDKVIASNFEADADQDGEEAAPETLES